MYHISVGINGLNAVTQGEGSMRSVLRRQGGISSHGQRVIIGETGRRRKTMTTVIGEELDQKRDVSL